MTLVIAILVLLNLLVFGIRAYAHSLKAAERHQISRLRHSTQVIAFFTRHPKILNGPHSKRAWRIVHYHQRIIRHATRRLIAIRQRMSRVQLPAHYREWLCIHRHEAAWNDPNGTYYGGLQMDWDFMRTWGRHLLNTKGTADHWTPLEQMWVAERAWRHRGFQPWPTRRYCGL